MDHLTSRRKNLVERFVCITLFLMITLSLYSCATNPTTKYIKALKECANIEPEDVRVNCMGNVLRSADQATDNENKEIDPLIISAASQICATVLQEDIREHCNNVVSSSGSSFWWEIP